MDPAITQYNTVAGAHEHLVAKYCNLLGTSLPGIVSYEDRIALNYLLGRPDVLTTRVGCLGLSGGGNRAALLNATHDRIAAAAIVGLMSTYAGLLDHNVTHSWLLFPYGWARVGDWPDLAACRAPSPLLVQYDLEDDLFTPAGMQDAHARLSAHYQQAGAAGSIYRPILPRPPQIRSGDAGRCLCLAAGEIGMIMQINPSSSNCLHRRRQPGVGPHPHG